MEKYKNDQLRNLCGYAPVIVPDPMGQQLPHLSQRNDYPSSSNIQSSGGFRKQLHVDADILQMRCYVLRQIFVILRERFSFDNQRVRRLAKNIELLLHMDALSKEEYADRSTLVSRIQVILRRNSLTPSGLQSIACKTSGSESNRFHQEVTSTSIDIMSDMQLESSMDSYPGIAPGGDFNSTGRKQNLANSQLGLRRHENFSKPLPPSFNLRQQLHLMRSNGFNSANVSDAGSFKSVTMGPTSSIHPQASGNFELILGELLDYLFRGKMCLVPQGQCDFLHCSAAKKYWIDILGCMDAHCGIPNCQEARTLWKYHQMCPNHYCTLCTSAGPRILLHQASDLDTCSSADMNSSHVGSKRVRIIPDVEIVENSQRPLKRIKKNHALAAHVLPEPEILMRDFSLQREFVANKEAEPRLSIDTGALNSIQGSLDKSGEKMEDSIDHAVANEPNQDNTEVNHGTQVLAEVSKYHYENRGVRNVSCLSRKRVPAKCDYRTNSEAVTPNFKISKDNQYSKRIKISRPPNLPVLLEDLPFEGQPVASHQADEQLPINPKSSMVDIGSSSSFVQGGLDNSGEETKDGTDQTLVVNKEHVLVESVACQGKIELSQGIQVPVEVPKQHPDSCREITLSCHSDNCVCTRDACAVPKAAGTCPLTKLVLQRTEIPLLETLEVSLTSTDSCVASIQGRLDQSSEKVKCGMGRSSVAKSEEVGAMTEQVKMTITQEKSVPVVLTALGLGSKPVKPKIKGVSLTELFTLEQIKEHITNLRQRVGQEKVMSKNDAASEHLVNENSCQLCHEDQLFFEPLAIFCSSCQARIKKKSTYHKTISGKLSHFFCVPCYNEGRYQEVKVDGLAISKPGLEKKRNDDVIGEEWVQCDKCEAWQHQICALFNGKRNDRGQAEYICPYCYMGEVERRERKPLPQRFILCAKDLPRTNLSDHLEQRLFKKLKQERLERAGTLEKNFNEVLGAESLVIRVVSSLDKKLEVKRQFLDLLKEENYPKEFDYNSKAILLFQKIEGVDICLFCMFVQEFGPECPSPNNRSVYLSYLDSVKYFRPDIRTVNGVALRTFVYHEILIGYLEYCKKRGFTSCYIWACPPLKGDDYILNCHPKEQKTPKSDKLREWYSTMLHKAANENIVVEITNLYDQFFVCTGERKAKVTAARLPYYDGDYWPGFAENIIAQIHHTDGKEQQKKGKSNKPASKRVSKTAVQDETSSTPSKDALLMQKLGHTISKMKDDFITVHMQYACSHCCKFILSGTLWTCNCCRNFHLCDKCYDAEQKLDPIDKHPTKSREKHDFYSVEVHNLNIHIEDKDGVLENDSFATQKTFLSLCLGNHYQFDSLRRAKHSSMMILYHLHNPNAPAFISTCNACHHDIEAGQGWRCETCPYYYICSNCYKTGEVCHDHKLMAHPLSIDHGTENEVALQR